MEKVFFEFEVLWSQVDANMHLRHSAYADFAAQGRLHYLERAGLDFKKLKELQVGPILFREESIYFREVHLNEKIQLCSELTKSRADGARWSIRTEIYRADGIKAAIVNVDGAWLDIAKRKLTALPATYTDLFINLAKSDDFVLE